MVRRHGGAAPRDMCYCVGQRADLTDVVLRWSAAMKRHRGRGGWQSLQILEARTYVAVLMLSVCHRATVRQSRPSQRPTGLFCTDHIRPVHPSQALNSPGSPIFLTTTHLLRRSGKPIVPVPASMEGCASSTTATHLQRHQRHRPAGLALPQSRKVIPSHTVYPPMLLAPLTALSRLRTSGLCSLAAIHSA